MAVTFTSDDWKYFKQEMEDLLANKRAFLENREKTWREVVEARAQISLLKTFLAMPENVARFPANKG